MAFLLRLHYFLIIFYNNVDFFFFELTVSFSVDSPGGDDDLRFRGWFARGFTC